LGSINNISLKVRGFSMAEFYSQNVSNKTQIYMPINDL
jgi:hypothetical protein